MSGPPSISSDGRHGARPALRWPARRGGLFDVTAPGALFRTAALQLSPGAPLRALEGPDLRHGPWSPSPWRPPRCHSRPHLATLEVCFSVLSGLVQVGPRAISPSRNAYVKGSIPFSGSARALFNAQPSHLVNLWKVALAGTGGTTEREPRIRDGPPARP